MKKTRFIILTLSLALLLSPFNAFAQSKGGKVVAAAPAPSRGNVEGITGAQMKDYLTFIASDELEGRDTPSRGLDIAALYIATQLSRWGLKPGGDNGSYFQPFALRRSKIDPLLSRIEINGQSFSFGEDFLAQMNDGAVTAPLVYVGHGWVIKSKNINAYQGVDVKDKIVVTTNTFPKGVTTADLSGKFGEDFGNAQIFAERNGAKGIIVIPSFQSLSNWATSRASAVEKGGVFFSGAHGANATPIPTVVLSPKAMNALFQGEKLNAAAIFSRALTSEPGDSFEFSASKTVTLKVAVKSETVLTKNVVGILEGSDPVLKNEYVAVGAHYDHVGMGAAVSNEGKMPGKDASDQIWNGADDDGSGTVAVMAMAEAFAKGARPKRSLLFIWHAGEEKGLWGADYFTNKPTVPINQIITQLNIDMIGRCRRPEDTNPAHNGMAKLGEVFVIGSKMMSTDLGNLSESVNNSFLKLTFNYKYDDPNDPERLFFRSDHFHYAQKGVPIIFYTDGDHEDYHRPSDSIEKIDFEQMEKVTRTILATAWELANRAQRPVVDKKLPAALAGN